MSNVVALMGLEVELAPEKSKMLLSAMLVWMFMFWTGFWLPKKAMRCGSAPISESSFLIMPAWILSASDMGDSEAVFRLRPLEVSEEESWLEVSLDG